MLPHSQIEGRVNTSYGVHAMELLINSMMRLGANRKKLVAKIFGGARVVDGLTAISDVGAKNIEFVKKFLDTERIPSSQKTSADSMVARSTLSPATAKCSCGCWMVKLPRRSTRIDRISETVAAELEHSGWQFSNDVLVTTHRPSGRSHRAGVIGQE